MDVDERTCCVCNAFCSKDELGRRDGKWESGVCVRKGLGGDGSLANCGMISTKLMKHTSDICPQQLTLSMYVVCAYICTGTPMRSYPERPAVCLRLCHDGLLDVGMNVGRVGTS